MRRIPNSHILKSAYTKKKKSYDLKYTLELWYEHNVHKNLMLKKCYIFVRYYYFPYLLCFLNTYNFNKMFWLIVKSSYVGQVVKKMLNV